jgi:nitroimidazol reductase NimA-like FMN-containing flavoprotein (pyridoxamine 5'-phosphate oxidase superfamily)
MSTDQPLPVDSTTRVRREPHRQVTDRSALYDVLDGALLAHVAVVRDGLPLVLPLAVARDGDSLLLHGSTGAGGLRLGAGGPVCVSVAHVDGLVFARTTFESSMRYRSAVVHGVAEVVPDDEKEHALEVLSDHLFADRTPEVRRPTRRELAATLVLRLSLESASVKVAAGPPEVDPDDHEPRDVWAGIVPLTLTAGEPLPSPDVPAGVPVSPSVERTVARFAPPR